MKNIFNDDRDDRYPNKGDYRDERGYAREELGFRDLEESRERGREGLPSRRRKAVKTKARKTASKRKTAVKTRTRKTATKRKTVVRPGARKASRTSRSR
jgi:hypothetical protein